MFGALLQMEGWNAGKMGFGILKYWGNGPLKAKRQN